MSSQAIEMLSRRIETLEKQLSMLLKDSSDKTTTIMETSQQHRQRDSQSPLRDKPTKKRGPNGYILFSNANRDEVKAKLLVGKEKLTNVEVMKELAQMWRGLNANEKAEWNAKAKQTNLGRGRKTKHIKKPRIKGTRTRRH